MSKVTPPCVENCPAGDLAAKFKICVVTAARSEYGLLRWLMQDIKDDPELCLQVLVTGSHLSPEFGLTVNEITEQGFAVDAAVDMLLSSASAAATAKGMGLAGIGAADALERLAPDILFVLGDRYELLPICGAALVMGIPIAHASGGDVTEGAIDDQIRHAVTKMAALHFPGSADSARRIAQMGEEAWRIHEVGEAGLDNIRRLPRLSRQALAADLGLDPAKDWVMFTWHPETKCSVRENVMVLWDIINALLEYDNLQIIATYANADYGGQEINEQLELAAQAHEERLRVHKNLGQLRYINLMREARLMAGNSSSGVLETPALSLPTLNVGDRQKGRLPAPNILSCAGDSASIAKGLKKLFSAKFNENLKQAAGDNPYGDGFFAEKTLAALKDALQSKSREELLRKKFIDQGRAPKKAAPK